MKRSTSRGIRHPLRKAVLYGVLASVGIGLVVLGVMDMRTSGSGGSPWLVLGFLPALWCPIAFMHAINHARAVQGLTSGRTAWARWTVPADEFMRFCEAEADVHARSVMRNFYRPPRSVPRGGVDVVVSDDGVLIEGGYFPLSVTRGRRLEGVRWVGMPVPAIEFTTVFTGLVRTSSTTNEITRTIYLLRVPVALHARGVATAVIERYQARLDQR